MENEAKGVGAVDSGGVGKTDADPTADKSVPVGVEHCRSTKAVKGSAWSRLSRELSDDDLNQPGTRL